MTAVEVRPAGGPLDATLDSVPGSKSIANRALICAALAAGTSVLHQVAPGDDTSAMLRCLDALGTVIRLDGTTATVGGTAGQLRRGPATLDAELAGTTSRFVTALAALGVGPYTVDGRAPLRARPMRDLHRCLSDLGASCSYGELEGHLPVTIRGGAIRGGSVRLPGDITSQYVTALMLVAPYFADGLRIELTSPLVSRPYLEITRSVMASFGHERVEVGDDLIVVEPGRYLPTEYAVEVDASSASYPLAAAAICGGQVTVLGLGADPLQGDARFVDLLAEMGCTVERSATATTVRREGRLRGIEVDMADISDTVPTLAAVAAFADGPTTITGIGFIRHKESDRIGDLLAELRRCGVAGVELADGLVIEPSNPHAATLATHHDHRLAMAFGLIGLAVPGVRIEDPDVVSKSWPDYWSVTAQLVTAR